MRYIVLLTAGCFLISTASQANEQSSLNMTNPQAKTINTRLFDMKRLEALFNSFKRRQAFRYANQHVSEMEGDPYFDYFYGVSAIDSGNANEGVFALERVLISFPQDQVARLELARGYFVLQEYALSRETFESVLATNPPQEVKDTAQAYLDKIRISESRYRPTHSGFISFSMGNDDNVNAGLDEGTSSSVASLLSADSFSQDDNFAELTGAWSYAHPFSPGWIFESTLSADIHKNQDLDEFDTATGTLQLGLTHLQATSKYKASLVTQQFQLDGEEYRSLNGINLNWQYNLNQKSSLTSSLQYAQLEYPDIEIKDSSLITLGVNYIHGFSGTLQPILFTSLSYGIEKAEDDDNPAALAEAERDLYSIRAGLILSLNSALALQSSIGIQNSQYDGNVTLQTSTQREDDYRSAELGMLWTFSRKWRLDSRFSYTENDSNDDLKAYERKVFDVTVNYTF